MGEKHLNIAEIFTMYVFSFYIFLDVQHVG